MAVFISPIQAQGNLSVIVDLAEMTFIDSNGLNVLVRAQQWILERGGAITLAHPRPQAAKVFDIVGFEEVFTIVGTGTGPTGTREGA